MHFLLCGKPALSQGQSLQVGKLKSFFLRRGTLGRAATSEKGGVLHSLMVQFSPSTAFTLSLFVCGICPWLVMSRKRRGATCLRRKCQANFSASIKWPKSTQTKGTRLIYSSWGSASSSVCATRNPKMPIGIFSGRTQRLVTEVESLTGWWKS